MKCSLQYKMKRVFWGKEPWYGAPSWDGVVLHYNSENIWQRAGKNILFKKPLLFVDKCMTYIAGMAYFKLHQ